MSNYRDYIQAEHARIHSRRRFISTGVLSGSAIALLAGSGITLAAGSSKSQAAAQDAAILNSAIAAEHQAVAAYQVGAESGLLSVPAKKLALQFQGHHKAHVDVLSGAVVQFGGKPVEALSKYEFPTASLKSEADVLAFAAGLERAAVSAYLNAVPMFDDRALSKAAASILGDEAMHWAVLRQALGQDPVPNAFMS